MKTDELDSLNRDEWHEINDECRSRAKRRLWDGAVCFLIVIASAIFICLWKSQGFEIDDILRVIPFCIFGLGAAWFAVNNLRFLQRVDTLVTPQQLLHGYEKKIKDDCKALFLIPLACIGIFNSAIAADIKYQDRVRFWIDLTIVAALVAFWIYLWFRGYYLKNIRKRDEEIIGRLQDLIDTK